MNYFQIIGGEVQYVFLSFYCADYLRLIARIVVPDDGVGAAEVSRDPATYPEMGFAAPSKT